MTLQYRDHCESIADEHKFDRSLTLEDAFVVQAALLEEAFVIRTDLDEHDVGLQCGDYCGSVVEDHKFDRSLTLEDAFVVQAGLLEQACVIRTDLLGQAFVIPTDPGERAIGRQRWDFYGSLAKDRKFERRLPLKELFVLPLLLAALAVRILLG